MSHQTFSYEAPQLEDATRTVNDALRFHAYQWTQHCENGDGPDGVGATLHREAANQLATALRALEPEACADADIQAAYSNASRRVHGD